MKNKVLIYGAGGHGKVVADILEKEGACEIAGFLDDAPIKAVFGHEVLGGNGDLERIHEAGIRAAVVAVGNNRTRQEIQARLSAAGFDIVSSIHPAASVGRGAAIGAGTVVAAGAVIGPDATIGEGCIVNHCASIDHDCRIGDFAHVAPGAHIGGEAIVAEGALIGTGASVRGGLSVGAWSIVGLGAAVVGDVAAGVTVVGVPAMIPRKGS